MDKFITLSITVTEEIESKKLLTFIRTQIKLKNLLVTDKSYFYFRFLPQALKYEVVLFQSLEDIYTSGIFTLSTLCEKQDQFTLFITPSFFAVYDSQTLLFVKSISDTSIVDIQSYIEQTYKIQISEIVSVNNIDLMELSKNYVDYKDKGLYKKIHKVFPDNSFKYFSIYFIIIVAAFLGFTYESYTLQSSQKEHKLLNNQMLLSKEAIVYKKHSNKNISGTVSRFLDFLVKENIKLKFIGYLGNNLHFKLISNNKKQLLNILEYPQKRLTLKSIKLDNEFKQYIMEITLHD